MVWFSRTSWVVSLWRVFTAIGILPCTRQLLLALYADCSTFFACDWVHEAASIPAGGSGVSKLLILHSPTDLLQAGEGYLPETCQRPRGSSLSIIVEGSASGGRLQRMAELQFCYTCPSSIGMQTGELGRATIMFLLEVRIFGVLQRSC